MLDKVTAYIEENQLIKKRDRIVLGVSGGADSVCLFSVLLELQSKYELELFVVHVHHGIRGEEADRDEQFVKALAEENGIPYYAFWKNIPQEAKVAGSTEEEAGRIARYTAFYEVLKQVDGTKIAVAHNQNDCAETVLFQLFRGSGLKGMCGISPKRQEIIRPLLAVERKEIELYLEEKGLSYCTDRTNLEQEYTRNKIRLSILPMAEREINGKAVEHITRTAQLLREVESYIERNVENVYGQVVHVKNGQYFMKIDDLLEQDIVIQRELVRKVLTESAGQAKDIEAKHVEGILSLAANQSGKQMNLPYRVIVSRQYEYLVFETEETEETKVEKKVFFYELIPDRTYQIEEAEMNICLSLEKSDGKWQEIPQNTCMKWFDYDKIENGICLRTRKNGDYFQVNAAGGTKKLKDYFIDKKVPRRERDEKILLADGSHIIWILGDRISEKYKITEATQNILKVTITEVK